MLFRFISVNGKQTLSMNFAAGADTSIILWARGFDMRDVVSRVLLVRVASTSGMPTGSQINVVMTNVLTLPDDPENLYTPFNTPATASITVNALDANFPRLYTSRAHNRAPPLGAPKRR